MQMLFNSILENKKFLVLSDQVIFSGNSFLTTILMARILTPMDFGIYASIILFMYLIINLLNAIIIQPLQVTLAGITNQHSYISFSFWILLGLVLLIATAVHIFLNFKFSALMLYQDLSLGIILFSSMFVMHDYFRKLFLAYATVKQALLLDIITAIFHISLLITALLFSKFTLFSLLIFLGLGYVPSIIMGVTIIQPRFGSIKDWKCYSLKHYHQSKWLLMTAFVQWWSSNLYVVASGILFGIHALGVFRLIQSLFGFVNVLLQTFENYILPQTSRLLKHSHSQAKIYLKQISFKTGVFFGFVLLAIFIFSKPIIVLAGGVNYAEYAYIVRAMSILYVFIFLGYPVRMAIRALILNRNFFFGYLFSLLFSLCSYNYLLEKWNLLGIIVGLIISQIIVISYWQFILIKNNFRLWK